LVIDRTAASDNNRIVGVTRNEGSKRRANSAGDDGLRNHLAAATDRTPTNTDNASTAPTLKTAGRNPTQPPPTGGAPSA
jgi:hypothetical protein